MKCLYSENSFHELLRAFGGFYLRVPFYYGLSWGKCAHTSVAIPAPDCETALSSLVHGIPNTINLIYSRRGGSWYVAGMLEVPGKKDKTRNSALFVFPLVLVPRSF